MLRPRIKKIFQDDFFPFFYSWILKRVLGYHCSINVLLYIFTPNRDQETVSRVFTDYG